MKVLLIRPQAPNKLSFINILDNEPLELEYLYTELKNRGIESYIYDGLIENISVKDTIFREKPDVVAVTGYITQQKLMIEYCSLAKEFNSNIITVVGGVHVQRNYEQFYDDNIDYLLRSESVFDFGELLSGTELSKINGLIYKKEGQYVKNELLPIDINSLPIPDRSFFNKHKSKYHYLHLQEVATIKTAFSCPYNCNFCYCTLLAGGKYRARDLSLVIEELKTIESENVQIVDDDFLVDKSRLLEFVRLVKENNIKKTYICYARADFVANNEDIVKELCSIGFKYFLVGLEAISNEELLAMNKQVSIDENRKCIEVLGNANAHCIALLIAPISADKEYFDKLYRFVKETKLLYVTVSIFTPIPGTPLYEEYKDKINSKDIEEYDFLHLVLEPEKLTKQQFYMEYYKLVLRLYNLAKKSGIYDFMDIKFYKNMLTSYLKRKMRGF
ncbi:B12-binding domain-containing radical SAM protein [Acetivibrio cellulolyticus]|uniref:B12-binding domain-containing radical SAM protein n=1 Tax=Acetivibrio cellulolyticus TaxID=35830 RepID=UPI0001E305B6|nr:B12-binding domain-containing radical SAM protein [Acetivibrio cellulolyticus]